MTSSPEETTPLIPTSHTAEGDINTHGPETPAPTFCLDSSALASSYPVIHTLDLALPDPLAPSPQQSTYALSNNVDFAQGIKEALPYANMEQAPYPPPAATSLDNIEATSKATTEEIHRAPSLLTFIDLWQRGTLATITAAVLHPTAALLQSYIEEGILVKEGQP